MTEMMIKMNKQEMDKAIAIGDMEQANRIRENLEYFLNEYKQETGKDYELEETSKEVVDSLIQMDKEATRIENKYFK